jgi:hypothetical protein
LCEEFFNQIFLKKKSLIFFKRKPSDLTPLEAAGAAEVEEAENL